MIKLKPITRDNFRACIKLKVSTEQKKFVADNAYSLAEAYALKENFPLAIYYDDTMVGFLMYGIYENDNEYWISRMMIDKSFQNMSYGRQALSLLIKKIKKDKTHNKIFIGAEKSNNTALKLYENMGFEFTGRIEGGEHIMRMRY